MSRRWGTPRFPARAGIGGSPVFFDRGEFDALRRSVRRHPSNVRRLDWPKTPTLLAAANFGEPNELIDFAFGETTTRFLEAPPAVVMYLTEEEFAATEEIGGPFVVVGEGRKAKLHKPSCRYAQTFTGHSTGEMVLVRPDIPTCKVCKP